MNTKHYAIKKIDYFSNVRVDVVSLIPDNPQQKILEIGAGGGNTLLYIKEKGIASEVMGVELMKIPNSHQDNPLIDKFQIANIEQEKINAREEYFDVILCPDVLEHLTDPWHIVEEISKYLKKDGLLIVSIPNIREWKTLFKVVFKGDFRYKADGGIMDKTHLRFFCKKNISELLSTPSLKVIYNTPNFILKSVPAGRKRRIMNLLSFHLFEDFLTVQYLFVAQKK